MENKKIKILIVDDDAETRSLYAEVMKEGGLEVTEAVNGLEGLNMAVKNSPDVVFTGIAMPRMDGFSLMESLKKNVATSNIPVVVSSHMGREEDKEKAYKLGAKEFIVKGYVSPREAVEKIKAIFLEEFSLKINPTELDALKLMKELKIIGSNLQCPVCHGELNVVLRRNSGKDKTFTAKLVCPKCKKTYD